MSAAFKFKLTAEFENDTPIDDVMTALDLLVKRWGDNSTRELIRYFKDATYIELGYHHDFSPSTIYRFSITARVADEMLARHLVEGTPRWGSTDMKKLRASDYGERVLWERRDALRCTEDFTAKRWILAWRGVHLALPAFGLEFMQ